MFWPLLGVVQLVAETVSYSEAWSLWWSGELSPDTALWGWKLLYWGRLGKVVAASAGLVILIDIAGEERLKGLGESIRSWAKVPNVVTRWTVGSALVGSGFWAGTIWLMVIGARVAAAVVLLVVIVLAVLAGVYVRVLKRDDSFWTQITGDILGSVAAGFGVLFFFGPLWLLLGLLYIPVAVVILPIGYILAHQGGANILRLASIILVLVGFHFDLLAS